MRIAENNYIQIQGWMVTELNLKGNELLVYALIYGFTQDGKNRYSVSINYISEWLSSTRQTVINTINSLEEKKLIIKEQETVNNNTINYYRVVKNLDQGSLKIRLGVVENLDHNNNIYNNNINKKENNIKEKSFVPPTLEEVTEYFKSRGLTSSSAKTFYDYYTTGCWKDGKGDKIKNWKQKVIAVWDKPQNKEIEITPENVQKAIVQEKEQHKQDMWLENCSIINKRKTGKLLLVNIVNKLLMLKDKEDFAKKVIDTMTNSILTEEQIQKVMKYMEGKI